MRLISYSSLLALVITAGCQHHAAKTAAPASPAKMIVTPETGLTGRVKTVQTSARYVILNFPVGRLPDLGQTLSLYRNGIRTGTVKVTGPQIECNIVADIVAGEAATNDEARLQ